MLRYSFLVLLTVGLIAVTLIARSQDKIAAPTDKTNVQLLMRDKLTHMQKVLDGMVTEDFDKVTAEAEMLRMIGRAASWQAIDTEEYRIHSHHYARLTSNLTKAAQNKNSEAVLLQYLQLNISCVDCHQYMREQQ